MSKFQITTIQFFNQSFKQQISEFEIEEVKSYSANIAINDKFIIQLSGFEESCNWDIPASDTMSWKNEADQDFACENYDKQEIIDFLEAEGVENNFYWLEDNADESY